MTIWNSSTAELGKSLSWERPQPHQNVQVGPTVPATLAFASVPRSRKAARKKTSRTKIAERLPPLVFADQQMTAARAKTALQYIPVPG